MENSLGAARAAIAGRFGIECDVMLSRDRVPIVFHDTTLERLTMASGRVSDWAWEELSLLALGNTKGQIPSARQFLTLIGGQVPVVMELKGTSPREDEDFLERLMPVISRYKGPLALMSFDPWLIDQAIAAGGFPVGLTAEGNRPEAFEAHREVFSRGCSFVSYNVQHLPNPFVEWVRTEQGAPAITWTVRTLEDLIATRTHADQMTFEGFVPQG
ncbi:MAG: glycerophosphodiester phosphodiesterase [Rhizobiaceae bacterium]|nr:glycerophosphodiester phosphodiesterase [Rhizobiaceae bacterium]